MNTLDNAKFIHTLFKKDEYSVKIFNTPEGKITCLGDNLPENKNLTYLLTGEWVNSAKYGRQFRVSTHSVSIKNDRDGIVNYLASGIIKGIGKKTAERIYDIYKEKSIDILKDDPRKLLKIRGISEAKLSKIVESYQANVALEELILFLSPYGFSVKQISAFYKKYKENTMSEISDNPYCLIKFRGVTFKMADVLGRAMGFTGLKAQRFRAALIDTFHTNMQNGSVGITLHELVYGIPNRRVEGLLVKLGYNENDNTTAVEISRKIVAYTKNELIAYVKKQTTDGIIQYFYLPEVKKIEQELAESIRSHARRSPREIKQIEKKIESQIEKSKIPLDMTQKKAISNAFHHGISIITGGPGTGKTTICNLICQIAQDSEPKAPITLLAPTGRAARKLAESTGLEASTIHSRLKLGVHENDQEYIEDPEPIEGGTVIIDEFSMVDMMLAHTLFTNIHESRIIIVGDKDQLESVGAGCVLRDLLSSESIPCTVLQYIHRQSGASTICENAEYVKNGASNIVRAEDFIVYDEYVLSEDYMAKVEEDMIQTYLSECKFYDMADVVLLSPFKRHAGGVYSLNKRIQEIVNPLPEGEKELKGANGMTFRVHDRVMQLINDQNLANGDIGVVHALFYDDDNILTAKVLFENGAIGIYNSDNNDQITLAYATTVHKSQGSEYKSVIMSITPYHSIMLKRNLFYTGITRAKEKVTLFTCGDAISRAIQNNSVEDRHTMLSYYLADKKEIDLPKKEEKEELYEQMRFA